MDLVAPGGKRLRVDSAWRTFGRAVYRLSSPTLLHPSMEWRIIGSNFLYATLGVGLMFLAFRVIDWLTPQVNFNEELRRGNVAVAIFVAALFLSIALIVGQSLN